MKPVNRKTKYIRIALIVSALLLLLGGAWILWPDDTQDTTPTQQNQNGAVENTDPAESQTQETEPAESQTQETEPAEGAGETDKPQSNPDNILNFPYSIPGSDLVIEKIFSYDGPFLEDGSDKEVTDVVAITLTNTGKDYAEYAEITFHRDDTQLKFVASALEPGGSMIVLEANGNAFSDGTYSNCVANIATAEEFTLSQDRVRVEEREEGGLTVTNLTQTDIPSIRIFYKFYKYDTNVYIGGITYTSKVTDLAAGGSCVVTPSHYLKGYSKIIKVAIYDTDV